MKALLISSLALTLVGSACAASKQTIDLPGSFEKGTAIITLRSGLVDIQMRRSDVIAAIQNAKEPLAERRAYLQYLQSNSDERLFLLGERTNKISAVLAQVVAPVLLDKAQAVVVERKNAVIVSRFTRQVSTAGEIGVVYLLPTGDEFLRKTTFIE